MISRNRQAGFTLIEMIVALVVLGLVLGLLVTRGPVRSRTLEIRATATELAGALRNTRAAAIRFNRPVTFGLDVARHSYRVDSTNPVALPLHMALSITAVSGETLEGRLGGITFEPDGSASGGRIEVRDGARRIQVGVDWLTGRVSIADAK
ncbi:MAG: ral secretion pathway protein [Rhodospirillaceae bacterium]|nr:ral secretion pathway protein [Rhodospirillaceae bacterium]